MSLPAGRCSGDVYLISKADFGKVAPKYMGLGLATNEGSYWVWLARHESVLAAVVPP